MIFTTCICQAKISNPGKSEPLDRISHSFYSFFFILLFFSVFILFLLIYCNRRRTLYHHHHFHPCTRITPCPPTTATTTDQSPSVPSTFRYKKMSLDFNSKN